MLQAPLNPRSEDGSNIGLPELGGGIWGVGGLEGVERGVGDAQDISVS